MAEDRDIETDPASDPQVHANYPEETMLYRKPTADSDEAAVQDIWGVRLETKVVDAKSDEFGRYLADGWARNPSEITGDTTNKAPEAAPTKSDNMAPVADALAAAEKLAEELGETVKNLTKERDDALAERDAANERAKMLEGDLSAERALREAGAEHIRRLEAEAKELKAKRKPA